jgi:SAM-dependent methyltransferase
MSAVPVLRGADGAAAVGGRWVGAADEVDRRLLARCRGPVLDVGCGPGRHTVALAERGELVLGVDITPSLLDLARPRGATVLHRSVFDHLPGTGRWGTALLLDANLGIGGDVVRLLDRLAELLRPSGLVLAEPDAGPRADTVRIEHGGRVGPWFPWVAVDEHHLAAAAAGHPRFEVDGRWEDSGRTFVALRRDDGR